MSDNLKERIRDMSVLSNSKTPLDALNRIEELEAKLINAMYEVATYSNDPHLVKWARESLAELKGETDE